MRRWDHFEIILTEGDTIIKNEKLIVDTFNYYFFDNAKL